MRQLKITQSITRRETASLKTYLSEIAKIPLLSAEEETELTRLVRQGDKRALHKLINANLRFVVSTAKQYQYQGLPLSDLINEGNIGLIKAAKRFDESKGFKFISYAIWWIRQSILYAIAEQAKLVRVPINHQSLQSKMTKAYNVLEQQYEREPSAEELAQVLHMEVNEIVLSLSSNNRHVSLDVPVCEDSEMSLAEMLENPNAETADASLLHKQSLRIELNRSLESLTGIQRDVLRYYFGIGLDRPLSLEDISVKFQLSNERIRQIKNKAILILQKSAHSKMLKSYL